MDDRRLKIVGGHVLDGGKVTRADVVINRDRIESVGLGLPEVNAETVDARDHLIIAGLCNAHTHGHSVFGRSIVDVASLEVLAMAQSQFARGLTPEQTYAGATLNGLEMLKTGATSVCDQFVTLPVPTLDHVEAVVKAYSEIGLRATIAPSASDRQFYGLIPEFVGSLRPDIAADLRHRRAYPFPIDVLCQAIERWHGLEDGRIQISVSPMIPLMCSDRLLHELIAIADTYDVTIHTHLDETRFQSRRSFARFGRSTTEHLAKIGMLSPRCIAAHAVWISDSDLQLLADHAVMVAHNPGANMRLGSGIARAHEMRAAGISLAVGTDGMTSSDNENMFEALRLAVFSSNIRSRDQRTWLRPTAVLEMAQSSCGQALGVNDRFGRVRPGFKADLVLLHFDGTYLHPPNDIATQLVLSESGSSVDVVIVDGHIVLRHGRSTLISEADILEAVDIASQALRRDVRSSRRAAVLVQAAREFFGSGMYQ